MRPKQALLLIAIVLASALNAWAGVALTPAQLNDPNSYMTLVLSSPHLADPLCVGHEQGLYLRTAERAIRLKGQPAAQSQTNGSQVWNWLLEDGRQVRLMAEEKDGSFAVKFGAEPNNDILAWGFTVDAKAEEYFTGLFERTVDGDQTESWKPGITEAMDLRGQRVEMVVKHTLGLYCPFYISSRGYSIFTEGTWPGNYDFCETDADLVKIEFDGPALSVVIDTAAKPDTLVQKHSLRAGPTIVPPRWVFRPWRWRDAHKNLEAYYDGVTVKAPYNSQLVEDILMMEAYGIPCGVYWIDRPWGPGLAGYDDFDWNYQRFPQAEKMVQWLHSKDTKLLLWIAPWVNGKMAATAIEKGYVLKNQTEFAEKSPLIDFTNPEARKWWQQEGLRKVLEDGVDGFKLDRAEEWMPSDRENTVFDGRTNREYRNHYPVDYVEATYQITKEIKGDDFILIPRAGYTGSSRYSGFWGGDIGSPQEGLRCAIIAQQRAAIIGYPIWGSDTGGYRHGDMDRQVCARWLAFSCFSPIMEVGPTEDRGLWNTKQPPHYDDELIAIWRLYAMLHDTLADYSYAYANEAAATGMPIVRSLFLQWPDQKECWQDWQTFMYGPDILVSAIWKKETTSHTLYLPAGTEWVDGWKKGQVYSGGQTITVQTPLHKIPIFVRKGASVKLPDLNALYAESTKIAAKKPNLDILQKAEFGPKSPAAK